MMSSSKQVIECQCGAKLRVPENAAGRRIKCPKCENRIQIPAEETPPIPTPAAEPDGGFTLLDDFMEQEAGAGAATTSDLESKQDTCPNCKTPIAKGAATCLMCGWEKSKAMKKTGGSGKDKSAARKLAVGGGKFALGCVLSAAGALIGAGIWYGVAVAASLEIGYIAWAVGLFAGFGMLWGYGKQDFVAAVVATAMALGGIFAAKWMIYDHFYGSVGNYLDSSRLMASHWADRKCTAPCEQRGMPDWSEECMNACEDSEEDLFEMDDSSFTKRHQELEQWARQERWEDPEYARIVLAHHFTHQAQEKEDVGEDEDDEWNEVAEVAKYKTQYESEIAKVDALSEEQRLEKARKAEKEKEDDYLEFAESLGDLAKEFSGGFFKAMFGPIDGLFVLLALGTAMKIGGGQDDD